MAGIINKIRDKGSMVLLVSIVVAMSSFILSDFLTSGLRVWEAGDESRTQIGKVGDRSIAYTEYENMVKYSEQQAQNNSRGEMDEYTKARLAKETWERMIQEILYGKEYESLGIDPTKMSEAEMQALLQQPQVLQLFGGSFTNVKEAYKQAETPQGARLKQQLQQIEYELMKSAYQDKYRTLLQSGVFVSKAEAKRKYKNQNEKRNFSFLAVNYSAIPDGEVKPSEEDFNNYYQAHQEEFKQDKTESVVRYVSFPVSATRADSLVAYQYLDAIRADFQKSPDSKSDSTFAISRNRSMQKFDFVFKNKSELDKATADRLAKVKEDSVLGPFIEGGAYRLIKVSDFQNNDTMPSCKIRHIELRPIPGEDTLALLDRAKKLRAEVTKDNFEELVKRESMDERSKGNKGEVGWYKYGMFGKDVDKAIKKAQAGQILAPIKGPQGYHIIEILDRSTVGLRLATIAHDIEPSKATLDSVKKTLDDLLSKMPDTASFNKQTSQAKLNAMTSQPLSPEGDYIQGINDISLTREIVRWSLEAKPGTMCPKVFTGNNIFAIAYVKAVYKEPYKLLADVKTEIKQKVMNELKAKKIKEKLDKAKGGDLEAIKNAYGNGAFVSKAEGVTFEQGNIQGVGSDPILVGKVFGMKANEISKPIVASTGVYVVQLTSVEEAPMDDKALEQYRGNLTQAARQQFVQNAEKGLRDYYKVKDSRHKFGY